MYNFDKCTTNFVISAKLLNQKKMYWSDFEFRWYLKVRIRLKKENTFFDDVIKLARVTCALY